MSGRRDFLALAAGAVAARTALPIGAADAADHPDAELLASCAAYDALTRAFIAAESDAPPGTPEEDADLAEQNRLTAARDPLFERLFELVPMTLDGHVARARSLFLMSPEIAVDWERGASDRLAYAVVRDLAGDVGRVVA